MHKKKTRIHFLKLRITKRMTIYLLLNHFLFSILIFLGDAYEVTLVLICCG